MINLILYALAAILILTEVIIILYGIAGLIDYLVIKTIKRAAKDKEFERDIASHLYMIRDMAPNMSSVTVIAMFVFTQASMIQLIAIFLLGFAMKHYGRKIVSAFYRAVEVEKEKKE